MSSDIYNTKLLDLLPPNLRSDPDIIAASQAVDAEFQILASKIKNVLTVADIDNACSEVVDNLAGQLHTNYYNSSLPLETRRKLAKNSIIQHMAGGTPSTVEELVTILFGDGEVEEWFDYNGSPYHFRVLTENSAVTGELADQFAKAVEAVKRRSTRLDSVIVTMSADIGIYVGNVIHTGDTIIVDQVV